MTVTVITDTAPGISRWNYKFSAVWATVRDGLVGDGVQNSNFQIGVVGGYVLYRAFPVFDTSVIPIGAIISAAKLQLYFTIINNTTATAISVRILNGQPVYPHVPVVDNDWDRTLYAGNGGEHDYRLDGVGAYIDTPLSAAGISWINPGGTTKLCLQNVEHDIANVAPGGGDVTWVGFSVAAGFEPKLEITWTAGGGAAREPALKRPLFQTPCKVRALG